MFLPRSVSKKVVQRPKRSTPPLRKPTEVKISYSTTNKKNQEDGVASTTPGKDPGIGEMGRQPIRQDLKKFSDNSQVSGVSSTTSIDEAANMQRMSSFREGIRTDSKSLLEQTNIQHGHANSEQGLANVQFKLSTFENKPVPPAHIPEESETGVRNDRVEDAPVISYSKSQRWPEDGEPVCTICGRYGEYICDKTEADVCSLECKARNLARQKQDHKGIDMITEENKADDILEGNALVMSYSYTECLEISRLSREQVQDIRAEFEIFVEGMDIPRPVFSFEQLFLPPRLLQNLKDVGYLTPTPVQMQIIPAALKGRDLMVSAQTSSGKTASFLIPSILHVLKFRYPGTPEQGPVTLILTPTRELAQQIEEQAKSLMKGIPNMKTALLVGGLPLPPQLHRLKQSIQVVIATPGRLLEIRKQGGLKLSAIKLLVIDEVDSMLKFGFQDQVDGIRNQLPGTHQTMLFSATIPAAIEKIAEGFLSDPIYVSIGTPSTPCSSVKQILLWVEDPSKKKKLFDLLEDERHYQPPILIFVDSKGGADLLAVAIEKVFGLDVGSIHGDKTQIERSSILHSFQEGLLPILVSTGVLGRGLDLPKVKLVINFDMPKSVEEYIHQIGRTGRLGTKGTAISFINNGNKKLFLELQKTLQPLGVSLPPELTNSGFLQLQREEHQRKGKRSKTHHTGKSWKEFKKHKR